MGRLGTIPQLPSEVREALQAWLRDPGISQTEATARTNALLAELGLDDRVSRHAVNRYDLRMRKVGRKLQESRQVAEAWIAKLGSTPGGQLGHLLTEVVRSLAFDLSLRLQESPLTEENVPGTVDLVNRLALASQRIEKAADLNVGREQKIRQAEREKAADVAEKTLSGQQGLSQQTIDSIKRQILGI